MPKQRNQPRAKDAVRVASFEVLRIEDQDPDVAYPFLRQLRRECQEIKNRMWQWWLAWHHCHRSADKIRDYLNTPKAERSKQPPVRLMPLSPEVGEAGWLAENGKPDTMYKHVADAYPHLHKGLIVSLAQRVTKAINKLPGKNKLPGWWMVLLGQGRPAFCNHPPPIEFKKTQTRIDALDDNEWRVVFRMMSKASGGTVYNIRIKTKGRKLGGQLAILKRIFNGDYEYMGTNLLYAERKRKWFAQICYRMPASQADGLDESRKFLVKPTIKQPLVIIYPSEKRYWHPAKSLAKIVKHKRTQLLTSRWPRQDSYPYSSRSRKGRGTKRALLPVEQFSSAWRDFVRTANQQLAKLIVTNAIDRGYGHIVYVQPSESDLARSCLSVVGKMEDRHDSTAWPWYQLVNYIGQHCDKAGVLLEVRKPGSQVKGQAKAKAKQDIELQAVEMAP